MRLLQQKGRTTNIFLLIDGSSNMQKHRRAIWADNLKLGSQNS